MGQLLHLLQEVVTTLEDSQDIFNILAWTEDTSWSVAMKDHVPQHLFELIVKGVENINDDGMVVMMVMVMASNRILQLRRRRRIRRRRRRRRG